ncbi:putative YCF1-vacuolar ABC transporter [Tilletiaria anomala UBC 951]|uniref:Putative YCF1-vacuolar ABC transporter n=1 Tax=Tilletiaria anomala (strain ATCC 24038 / CBS 436.72 / UBC 951) TaxID=1037660 RepID=A0A066WQ56_TILAU|nr:putative YCF1-vacuolar ABC transporter [Tilletiaria anomala UBC 951]KDN53139.1 putative YCF1-vacuolar ABC transporter [Tilletiaria anomala UBC 951]
MAGSSVAQWAQSSIYAAFWPSDAFGVDAHPSLGTTAQNVLLDQAFSSPSPDASNSSGQLAQTVIADPLAAAGASILLHVGKGSTPPRWIRNTCRNYEGWGPLSQHRDLDFTPCFLQAVFIAAPVLLLALFGAANLVLLAKKEERPLSRFSRSLLRSKEVIVCALAVLAAVKLSLSYGIFGGVLLDIQSITPLITFLGYLLILAVQRLNHTRTRRSSTILLFFWLEQLIAHLLELHNTLSGHSSPISEDTAGFIILVLKLVLLLSVFGLECAGVEVGSLAPEQKEAYLKQRRQQLFEQRREVLRNGKKSNGYSELPQHHANGSSAARAASAPISAAEDSGFASVFSDEGGTDGGYDALNVEKECPINTANAFSRLTFNWMQPMMSLGSQKFLGEDDMWSLPPDEDAEALGKRFAKHWKTTRTRDGKPRIWLTLAKAYGGPFFFAAVLKAAQDTLAFAQPQVLRKLLQFVQNWDTEGHKNLVPMQGYVLSALLFFVAIVQTSFLHQYFQLAFMTGMRVRAGLVSAIYKKSLRLSNNERGKRATGDIVNLMSVDATRLQDLCTYGHIIWSALFQMTLAFISLYSLMGWQAFVGVAIMVVSVPLNTVLARYMKKLSEKQMVVKDRRTRMMNEILQNIKTIKLFAWEDAFAKKLNQVRNVEELRLLRVVGTVSAFFNFFWTAIPFLVSLATFTTYAFTSDVPLTADVIFPALSLFSLLQFPIAMLASIITAVIAAQVSARRLAEFLDAGELDPEARKVIIPGQSTASADGAALTPEEVENARVPEIGDDVVTIRNGEFEWSKDQPVPTLQDIDLTVKKGELLAVLGKVGDGKSSLLAAILGEMNRTDGEVVVKGRTAYFSQGGWAMGATVRDNILFGLKYEPDFYQRVIDACALGPDLNILPNGDQTEIGERGVSLSGGQRARVALARACYARADIYLLDDPLAAVDAHVASHIFEHVIGPNGMLKSKARILTLNSVAALPQCDQIISVRRGIILDERGTYAEVMARKGELYTLITGLGKQSNDKSDDTGLKSEGEVAEQEQNVDEGFMQAQKEEMRSRRASSASMRRPQMLSRKQIKAETLKQLRETSTPQENRATGSVSWEVYKQYAKSSNLIGVSLYLAAQVLTQVFQVGRDVVLKQYAAKNLAAGGVDKGATTFFLGMYATVGLSGSLMMCVAPFILLSWLVISSARRFHDGMYSSVMSSPLQWFETIPTGRLLNLFSRDINVIDETLPRVVHSAIRTGMIVTGVLVVVSYSVPPFLVAVIPLGIGYHYILKYYLATSRELKRLDSISKSPIFQFFSETLGGLSSVRAFGQEARFIATSLARVDRNQQCYFPSVSCNRWLAVRIEFVGSVIILIASMLAVVIKTRNGNMEAGLLGLMMSQTLNTTQALNWVVRSVSEVEQNIVSVERILSYSELTPEAPLEIPDNKPPAGWPSKGDVALEQYSTRYRPELPLVLKGINVAIRAGERIGVCGRTGAGKSSLALALFRIIEPTNGRIIIDGVDATKIGLKDLRRSISIIPQDANIWEGTLRDNLDPTGETDDAALWRALDSAHLREHVNSLEGRLDAKLCEGGTNFSSGQRQLICIARAFLRQSEVLILDEATANIDLETDDKLQKIVRSEFKGTTITVAHRLNTIMDSSRILVLKDGEVAEFDTPENLLLKKTSIFFSMAVEAGLVKVQ